MQVLRLNSEEEKSPAQSNCVLSNRADILRTPVHVVQTYDEESLFDNIDAQLWNFIGIAILAEV